MISETLNYKGFGVCSLVPNQMRYQAALRSDQARYQRFRADLKYYEIRFPQFRPQKQFLGPRAIYHTPTDMQALFPEGRVG